MSRSAIRTSLASLAMAIAAGVAVTPAIAAPDAPPPPPAAGQPRGPMMDRDGMWIPGLGPLSKAQVESLKLDAKQQALFDKARDASRQAMEARRQSGPAPHELLEAQLNAGKLDPHALAAEGDKRRAQFEGQEAALRTQWLAVWDSLNDAQRTQVTQIVKERVAKMKEHHGKRGEHRPGRPAQPAPAAQ
ncbi:periplasmic heavy metal sensor [Bordetella genomosp. 12]|nr:periplasmic heavy metal sensor [Bordetella genomosp. 12]